MEFFDALSKAIGPVGALACVGLVYMTQRIFALQDKMLELGMASKEFQTNVENALDTIKDAVKEHK